MQSRQLTAPAKLSARKRELIEHRPMSVKVASRQSNWCRQDCAECCQRMGRVKFSKILSWPPCTMCKRASSRGSLTKRCPRCNRLTPNRPPSSCALSWLHLVHSSSFILPTRISASSGWGGPAFRVCFWLTPSRRRLLVSRQHCLPFLGSTSPGEPAPPSSLHG